MHVSDIWRCSVKDCKTKPGADCNSDHQLLTMNFKVKFKGLEGNPHIPVRLDYSKPNDDNTLELANRFQSLPDLDNEVTPNDLWTQKNVLCTTAYKRYPKRKYRQLPWNSPRQSRLLRLEGRSTANGTEALQIAENIKYKTQ